MAPTPPEDRRAGTARLELKAALLLALLAALLAAAGLYLLYARGAFEATQRLVLVADEAEGVRVGMDLSFSGFPIGRVRGIELDAQGSARILVDVPRKDARWLRESSVFTLVRNVLGGTSLHAYTGVLAAAPLPDGAERKVLIGDTGAELQRVVSAAREVLQNVGALTASDSALGASLANLQATTERLKGPRGALGVLLGDEREAARVGETLARTNALLARLDATVARADAQLFGGPVPAGAAASGGATPGGAVGEVRASVRQLDALLGEARGALRKADATLGELQAVAANARVASTDLGALRGEVDASLRKVQHLIDEIDRKWPFARERGVRLP